MKMNWTYRILVQWEEGLTYERRLLVLYRLTVL